MLDRCSITSQSIEINLLWTPLDSSSIAISHFLILDASQSIEKLRFLYIVSVRHFSHFSPISLDRTRLLTFLNTSLSLQTSFPSDFRPRSGFSSLVRVLNPSFFMHFMHQTQVFGFLKNFFGFLKIDEVLVKFFGMGCK